MRILSLSAAYQELPFRTPLVFATGEVRTHTLATVQARVELGCRRAVGWGSILLGTTWAWPGDLPHETRDAAMRGVLEALCARLQGAQGHPLDLWWEWKGELKTLSRVGNSHSLSQQGEGEGRLPGPASSSPPSPCPLPQGEGASAAVPPLASLVATSPVDAALHDAYGRLHGVDSYTACGPEFLGHDLSSWLGKEFRGRYVTDYLRSAYAPTLPAVHLVGGADRLRSTEISDADPRDDLPVSLEQWIARDGLWAFKVKLKGTDPDWDLARLLAVVAAIEGAGVADYALSVDTNEMCPAPEAMVELLGRFRAACPRGYERLRYLEQPTARDLAADRHDLRKLAALKPVLADEGVTGLESLALALDLGWSGLALKTCKGHSAALLYVALLEVAGRPYSVQDLTNPGLALVHSAGLAARTRPLLGVEYNARQYLPTACPEIQDRQPDLFTVSRGTIRTGALSRLGLGYL